MSGLNPMRSRELIRQEMRREKKEKARMDEFFKCIVHGKVEGAKELLKEKSDLSFQKSAVTDLSQRTYKMMTGFQYALWALDGEMWEMLLQYMSTEEAAVQFLELEKAEGTGYGKCFNLEPFTKALNAPEDAVGRVERLLPKHLINKYLSQPYSFEALQSLLPIIKIRQRQRADLGVKLRQYGENPKQLVNTPLPQPPSLI